MAWCAAAHYSSLLWWSDSKNMAKLDSARNEEPSHSVISVIREYISFCPSMFHLHPNDVAIVASESDIFGKR